MGSEGERGNPTERKVFLNSKYCEHCFKTNHNTEDCFYLKGRTTIPTEPKNILVLNLKRERETKDIETLKGILKDTERKEKEAEKGEESRRKSFNKG